VPASLRSEDCSPSARNAVRVPFGITVRLRRNPQYRPGGRKPAARRRPDAPVPGPASGLGPGRAGGGRGYERSLAYRVVFAGRAGACAPSVCQGASQEHLAQPSGGAAKEPVRKSVAS
jgi:hypothetical protein